MVINFFCESEYISILKHLESSFNNKNGRRWSKWQLCSYNYSPCILPLYRKRCHRCVVIYEKHKNVLQYKESECEDKDHFNPSALTSRSIIKSDQNRGVASASHPNMNGKSSSDQFVNFRSADDNDDCKQTRPKFLFSYHFISYCST